MDYMTNLKTVNIDAKLHAAMKSRAAAEGLSVTAWLHRNLAMQLDVELLDKQLDVDLLGIEMK